MAEIELSIIGSGSWGTALGMAAARNAVATSIWGPEPEQLKTLESDRCNLAYLGDYPFPESLHICHDFETAAKAPLVLLAVPSHVFGDVIERIKPHLSQAAIAWATKGLDPKTDRFPSEMVQACLGDASQMAVLSGPSFAKEVARDCPTAVTIASNHRDFGQRLKACFVRDNFQVDLCDDLIGTQLGGAAKNVIAIATGIADSVNPSANTRAAIITRGLAEIKALGHALGAEAQTLYGLSGMGDLVLTCSDDQSRNRRFGLALGRGLSQEAALTEIGQVVEGLMNTEQILKLAARHRVSMPITEQVKALLNQQTNPQQAILNMLKAD